MRRFAHASVATCRVWVSCLALLCLWSATPQATAAPSAPPELRARLPQAEVASRLRPSDGAVACSWSEFVCAHEAPGTKPDRLLDTLTRLERAMAYLTRVLQLPPPLFDGALGGTPAFDVYLVRAPPGNSEHDPPLDMAIDRTSAYGTIDVDLRGEDLDLALALAVAEGILWGRDAAERSSFRTGTASYLASLVTSGSLPLLAAIEDAQSAPESGLFDSSGRSAGASLLLFTAYLDESFARSGAGTLPVALAAIGAQKTPDDSMTWLDEPDAFDVLRQTLKNRTPSSRLSDLLLDFAISRAFLGERDDGLHVRQSAFLGSFGRVRFEWVVPFSSLPRRLSPSHPLAPTGASYLWIDLQDAPSGLALTLHAEWETPTLFRWAVVRLDPQGKELSRVILAGQEGSSGADKEIDQLDGLSGLLIVGTHVGGNGPSHPFDPDDPLEPHGYTLTLAPR